MKNITLSALLVLCCARTSFAGPAAQNASQDPGAPPDTAALGRYLHYREETADASAVVQPYIAVMPFEDKSGFRKNVWDLENDLARMLSEKMGGYPDWRVVPYEVVSEAVAGRKKMKLEEALAFGRRTKADMIVRARLRKYNMSRFGVGDPIVGGYKSYGGIASIELRLVRVEDQREIGRVETKKETVDRDLGMDLLGKPRDQDVQFMELDKIDFGSEEFAGTPIGQATIEAMDDLIAKMSHLVRPNGLKVSGEPAKILSVHGDEVYVNVGSENGVYRGYRFAVYPDPERVIEEKMKAPERVGVLEVLEVIGARLSSVRLLEGGNRVRVGDRLKLLEVDIGGE